AVLTRNDAGGGLCHSSESWNPGVWCRVGILFLSSPSTTLRISSAKNLSERPFALFRVRTPLWQFLEVEFRNGPPSVCVKQGSCAAPECAHQDLTRNEELRAVLAA